MRRTTPLLSLLVAALASVLALSCSGVAAPPADEPPSEAGGGAATRAGSTAGADHADKPNILFVMTDDMKYDDFSRVGRFGRLLTERGTSFTRAYHTNPLCCPSRVTALTGRYSHSHGVADNDNGPNGGYEGYLAHDLQWSTLPLWLKGAGYRTALFGKYLNGYGEIAGKEAPKGFDAYTHRQRDEGGDGVAQRFARALKGAPGVGLPGAEDPQLGAAAAEWVDANHDRAPLYLWLCLWSPHEPLGAAQQFEGTHADDRFPRPPSFDEEDVSDKPRWAREEARLSPDEEEQLLGVRRTRLDMLEGSAAGLERVLDAFSRAGELDDTYVVFTSDNGIQLGEHRLSHMEKSVPYEESARAPLVVSGPGIPQGQERDELVGNIDLAPTMAEWAGADAPDADGRPLSPLLTDRPAPEEGAWRERLLVENNGEDWMPGYAAVFEGDRFRYVEWDTGERELYDLSSDPYQATNLLHEATPEAEARADELSARLRELKGCAGDSCRAAENADAAQEG